LTVDQLAQKLSKASGLKHTDITRDDVAHLFLHHHDVVSSQLVPGLHVETKPYKDGIFVSIRVDENTKIAKPVHMCFGMLPETGVQHIYMDAVISSGAYLDVIAHCTFPNAVDVKHLMDATIEIQDHAHYAYFERHVHGDHGGIQVIPQSKITVKDHGHFSSEFELLKGRVGLIDMKYETTCQAFGVMEMNARINGKKDDRIKINEIGHLVGEYARGVLTSRVAVRDRARADIFNTITASAAYARGHVDCKEIIQDQGIAKATPIVEVSHPKAHVTHEASLGSVDSKQLQTLMARGLSEDDATDLIIEGLLS